MIITEKWIEQRADEYAFGQVGIVNDAYFFLYNACKRDWEPYIGMEETDARRKMRLRRARHEETLERVTHGILLDKWEEDYLDRRDFEGRYCL